MIDRERIIATVAAGSTVLSGCTFQDVKTLAPYIAGGVLFITLTVLSKRKFNRETNPDDPSPVKITKWPIVHSVSYLSHPQALGEASDEAIAAELVEDGMSMDNALRAIQVFNNHRSRSSGNHSSLDKTQ